MYFRTYEWKNVTLTDFLGCLQWTFSKSRDETMGDNFNFLDWCHNWLRVNGPSILEPLIEYNDDQSIKKLVIKQHGGLRK